MTNNIYDLANELDRAIRELPEYKAVQAAKVSIDKNPQAKAVLDDYLAFQRELQGLLQSGQTPDASVQEKMNDFGKQVQGNALLTEYFNKQQQLSVYIADLEKIIFKPLQDLL